MARSTYDEDTNHRTYSDPALFYTWGYEGREITAETVFDEVRIKCSPDAWVLGEVWIYNDGTKVSQVPAIPVLSVVAHLNTFRYLPDDPEVMIIRQKIIDGECVIKFLSVEDNDRQVLYSYEEFHSHFWLLDFMHPFHDDDKNEFFDHLTRYLEHTAAEEGKLQIFKIRGIWKDDSLPRELIFFKRGDTEQFRPDILFDGDLDAFIQAHEDEGWLLPKEQV